MRLQSAITEDKGDSVLDPLRIAFLIAFALAMGLQAYVVLVKGSDFDIQSFGIGIGSLIGTTGAALWASSHQKDEP